ncbi:hypothetical protein RRG08_008427 [Elysia crispata]|uniref:Uncharacterized protein n=1 Tax=Elysia crispata TaxID=231223 RepID=A0AAE1DG93_9GAST|nr:hypothetical protein RRG08_008427 [Elysia crispata]
MSSNKDDRVAVRKGERLMTETELMLRQEKPMGCKVHVSVNEVRARQAAAVASCTNVTISPKQNPSPKLPPRTGQDTRVVTV